jgi:phage terminase small subunit
MPSFSETPVYDRLNWRHKMFVDAWIETGIATKAIQKAGYTGKRPDLAGGKLRRKPKVAQAIAERERLAIKVAGGTAAEVLDVIWDTLRRCRQAEPVIDRFGRQVEIEVEGPDGKTKIVPAYTFDAKNALKAAELLGKHHKLFVEQHAHTLSAPGGGPVEHAHRASEKLAQTIDPNDAMATYSELVAGEPEKKG